MKLLSYILALFLTFLTIHPTLALANENTETECCGSFCGGRDDGSQNQDKKAKNDCKDENCNPFEACGCCLGFTVKTTFFEIRNTIIQSEVSIVLKENTISQFSPDVWQPPKLS